MAEIVHILQILQKYCHVWMAMSAFFLQFVALCILQASAEDNQVAPSSNRLELKVGLRLSVRASFDTTTLKPISNATMFNNAIPAFAEQGAWFLPILSSSSFNSSDASQSPGFSFGVLFENSASILKAHRIFLAVCGGISGNITNVTDSAFLKGADDGDDSIGVPYVRDGYVVPVWVANPSTSLTSYNVSLVVVEKAGSTTSRIISTRQLQLQDHHGNVIWKVSNVGLMELQDTGILVIYDSINRQNVVWESFKDTLFVGEMLRKGNSITSRDSSYSARMEEGAMVLYFNKAQFMNQRLAPYLTIPILFHRLRGLRDPSNPRKELILASPCSDSNSTAYATFGNDSYFNIQSGLCQTSSFNLQIFSSQSNVNGSGPLSFVKLQNSGWLSSYAVPLNLVIGRTTQNAVWNSFQEWNYTGISRSIVASGWSFQYNCAVPNVCGPLGICSPDASSPCSCPSSFDVKDRNDISKGCMRVTRLPECTVDEHLSSTSLLQLNHTTSIFLFNEWYFHPTFDRLENCRLACLSNCSCSGFFYKGDTSACFYITDEQFSLINVVDNTGPQLGWWQVDIFASNYITYLKVAKPSNPLPLKVAKSTSGPTRRTMLAIVLASSSTVIVIGLGLTLFILHRRARQHTLSSKRAWQAAIEEEELRDVLPLLPTRFSYKDLYEFTDGFDKLLGAGGCGYVYAGKLPDGRKVAVKILQFAAMKAQSRQFLAEVATIGQTNHHNIVRLVGFCWEASSRLLVYEYMERGSLDQWLFKQPSTNLAHGEESLLLSWETRYNVVLGIARGLHYLHEECLQPILHFDIKPQNILLDGAFVAKLADFGMSKLIHRDISEVVTGVRGTPGYIAPEWVGRGAVSKRSDIYSLGMVMLEIVSGRKNLNLELLMNGGADFNDSTGWFFPSWAARKCEQGLEMELVDERLQGKFNEEQVVRLIYTAFWCIQEDPAKRPFVPTVVHWLEGSSSVKQPPFSSAAFAKATSTSECLKLLTTHTTSSSLPKYSPT